MADFPPIEEEDFEAVYADDYGVGDPEFGPRRRGRPVVAGPTDVTFHVFVDPPPAEGELVMLRGSLPELRDGVVMNPCETGARRLWRCAVRVDVPGGLGVAAAPGGGMLGGLLGMGSAGSGLGPMFNPTMGGAAPPTLECGYQVCSRDGRPIREDQAYHAEHGGVQLYYYHAAKFGAGGDKRLDDAFPLFVHEEVHLMQNGLVTDKEFMARFVELAGAPFARRSLLDKALEELIKFWAGGVPPPQLVLMLAATLGFFRRQQHGGGLGRWGDNDLPLSLLGMGAFSMPERERERDRDRDREPPPSLIVCRWIVQHCPARQDLDDDERREARTGPRGREAFEGGMSASQLQRYTQLGVLQAAETLYIGEKTFDWLKLLNFLPEHTLPPPISASQCTREEREKLQDSFKRCVVKVFGDCHRKLHALKGAFRDEKEKGKAYAESQQHIDLYLRGLCNYCPSIDSLKSLVRKTMDELPGTVEQMVAYVNSRIRSMHFGAQDKEALKSMIREIGFVHSDDSAIALLTNTHHPSESFKPQEIINFVKLLTETRTEVRSAGLALQGAARKWLMKYYGRQPERPDRKDDKQGGGRGFFEHQSQKEREEIREAIRCAIGGWYMVLSLPCFKQEEEILRLLLFELSQAYFFKDPEPLVVLSCLLDLEPEIRQVSSVRAFELELQRIAIKSVRDAQDAPEVENVEELLRLLFEKPSPLRFVIVEAFIGFRQAALDLGKVLQNEPIWTLLLSPAWKQNRDIQEYALGATQRSGLSMLTTSAQQLSNGTIELEQLHTILKYKDVYEKLVAVQVSAQVPTHIPAAQTSLNKFDNEFRELRVYTKLFCTTGHIDAVKLEAMVEDISTHYTELELKVAAKKFEGLPVRPHLRWLYGLRGSDVFNQIWKDACGYEEGGPLIQQSAVVSTIIPRTRATWEKLAKSIETGKAVLEDIRWCVDLEWAQVQRELELLEHSAPKDSRWVPRATVLTQDMRLAAKLREWAPSMLRLREVLGRLFKPLAKDECVDQMKTVVQQYEQMWKMPLGQMSTQVAPFSATIKTLSEAMQDYVIILAKHDQALLYLLEQSSLEDFNHLISLCRPNTDDSVILAALASLQQTRTFLAETLYSKPPYASLRAFLGQLATLGVDETVHASLQSIQQNFKGLLDLLTTHSRTPGVQACYDLKKISESGTFHVKCSLKESEQIYCSVHDGEFDYETLAELRRQLLMTDVPAELDGARNLGEMLEDLVRKFGILEDYGRCAMSLFALGHFAYHAGQNVLSIKLKEPVDTVERHLRELQLKLADWERAVGEARGKYYFLNYFTVREVCHLVQSVPQCVADERKWREVWPLLRVVHPSGDAEQIRKLVAQDSSLSALGSQSIREADRLNHMGQLLNNIFRTVPPVVRKLDKLAATKQLLQGDLLIRGLQTSELGVPIFVCCAEDASKVTDLVLSIYTRRERVPEAEELLLCSANTTLEQIELLLRRFFSARSHKREDRLYCLGNIHLLPYVVQCGTVEALRRLEEQVGYASASALVFVSGLPNQMLTNALNRHNIAVSVLPSANLREAVKRVGEMHNGRELLQAVASKLNGVGKTHHIMRRVSALQEEHGNAPVLHHVEIRETTDISSLVERLLSDPTDPKTPTAVHIDLAHILPSHVDMLLFEVLIVGMLRDPQHNAVYHRRAQDFFFVEVPNTPEESTAKQLSFCLLLPRQYLTMSAEALDPELPVLERAAGQAIAAQPPANVVKFVKNQNLLLVGKTLAAMQVEAFNPKSKDFNVNWTAKDAAEEEPSKVYTLLYQVCCSDTSPPSFLVFQNFIKFLGELVKGAEGWSIMNLQLLQNFNPGLKHFKHCFYRLLIETSRDFALRQVPKAHVVGTSPLAPSAAPLEQARNISNGAGVLALGLPHDGGNAAAGVGGPPTAAARTMEATQPHAVTEVEVEAGGIGRIDATAYAARFDSMPAWETCVHPIACFKRNEQDTIVGCNIMSLQKDFMGHFIDRNLQNSLNLNDLKLERDWSKVTHKEAVQLVLQVEGGELVKKKETVEGPRDYVVTVDNLLKLMSIQQRLRYKLPVIVMGETGCGKTALVRFLAQTLDFQLFTLDIHGGVTDEQIMAFMDHAIEEAKNHRGALVFFDEINAANCMALFKSIIIDRCYGNTVLPENLRLISACNPYRLRHNVEDEGVAIVYQHTTAAGSATGITDPMKKLVYRVHPLPESLIDVVSDFGALSEKSEEIYISAILRKELPKFTTEELPEAEQPDQTDDYEIFMNTFRDLLCASQKFVREVNANERSVVSMRDIARAARVFKWFLTYYSKLRGVTSPVVSDDRDGAMKIQVTPEMRPHLRSAVVLTLGYCYHARLNRDARWGYRQRICNRWREEASAGNTSIKWLDLENEKEFEQILIRTQYEFVEQMDRGEGIALNEALRENLFMLLVSVMNQIPILLIGKPGCSKSLAMGVLQSNLNGPVSQKEFFQSMPAVEVFAYQCSPLSTPDAILNAFHAARQSNLHHKSTIVCVLLDEVGLAEESPHLPLKVLHKELEDLQGISCVGISNWALDAAKMSRCVTLYRPPPTVDDLIVTAEGMVVSANLKGYLKKLSEAFFEIYKTQMRPDFWGMREFYSTVRVINAALKERTERGEEAVLEPQVLLKTVQRNYGGCSSRDLDICIEEFFERVGMDAQGLHRYSTRELIKQNLGEVDARHLMLLTKNNAALRLLFESELLDHSKAEVMFGSTFPNDQSDVFVAMNLQRIKSFMQQPISLVMVHCDSLYESLYDLLNQHYMEYAGQRYVRIAHGSKAKQCPIHKQFRVIVITEISDAYFRLAPPLLNRFEKQIFLRKDLMEKPDEALLKWVSKLWEAVLACTSPGAKVQEEDEEGLVAEPGAQDNKDGALKCRPIAGYHAELLSSLVFTLRRQKQRGGAERSQEELFAEARRLLTQVLTPEAVCIVAARYSKQQMQLKFGFDLVSEYFEKQQHLDLPSFAEDLMKDTSSWCDQTGAQVVVMTYSPIRGKVSQDLSKVTAPREAKEVSLHELSSSQDIEKVVGEFYSSAGESKQGNKCVLLIHADPAAASLRMIEHCRFVCEKARKRTVGREGARVAGKVFVILVIHLQRGNDRNYSFDFDSQWHVVFLDSVEPMADIGTMPPLRQMLNMPLIEVVKGVDFPMLLKQGFRSALSRLIYPHTRKPADLQKQINQILEYLRDGDFVTMVREWTLKALAETPKDVRNPAEGSVGNDTHWFATIATAAHELAIAGTFRAALHNRIIVLVTSLLTALLAHLDRNHGLALLADAKLRKLWLQLSSASLTSSLSGRLHTEAVQAMTEAATAQHEVGTDAQTHARPFASKFPASWFVARSISGFRHTIESRPKADQLKALAAQYQMSKLKEIGLDPYLDPVLLDAYLADFTAMHMDWCANLDRAMQQRITKRMLQRFKGGPLNNILEIHQLFWNEEKRIAYCINLLNAVPLAVPAAERLIEESDIDTLNLDLLLLVHQTLTGELGSISKDDKNPDLYANWFTRKQPVSGLAKDLLLLVQCTVHQTLTGEVQGSIKEDDRPQEFYVNWLMRKQVVAGLTKDYLASVQSTESPKLTMLLSDHEPRMETLALLLQHCAYPLNLPRTLVQRVCTELPPGKVRHPRTLLAIFNLAKAVTKEEHGLQACSAFAESWMLDVCLRDAESTEDSDDHVLRLFCALAAGLPLKVDLRSASGIVAGTFAEWAEFGEVCIASFPDGSAAIPRSSCLNLALLRKLIVRSVGAAHRLATNEIEELLVQVDAHAGHNDTTLATKFAVLCEEHAANELGPYAKDPARWPDLSLELVFPSDGSAKPARKLKNIGKIRWMLTHYAGVLCADEVDLTLHSAMVTKLDPVLQTDQARLQPVCRSIRLYLLKCMERQRGVSFVRGHLVQEPLCNTKWVGKWKDLHDIDFEKFLGASLVPKWNPFSGVDETPEYHDAKVAVLDTMTSTAIDKLDAFAKNCAKHNSRQQKKDVAGLLLALCQEPGLLAPLEDEQRRPPWRATVNQWLATSKDLPVSDKERMLLRLFAGDSSMVRKLKPPDNEKLGAFSVMNDVSMDHLLRWRFLGHVAAVLIACPPTSVLSTLRKLMLEPQDLVDMEQVFLPAMDEDIRNRVLKAMLERGENIWRFKSHWYKCTCGYTFFIGECGRPMEVSSCPQCKVPIGGKDHSATAATKQDEDKDRSPPGYMLPTAEQDEKHVSFRDIPSSSARAIRLLLHAAMFCGVAASIPQGDSSSAAMDMPNVFRHLVNTGSMCTMHKTSEALYLGGHFLNDFEQMVEIVSSNVEDLAASLHALLNLMGADPVDQTKSSTIPNGSWEVLSIEARQSWEETIENKYITSMVKNYDSQLQRLYQRWGGANEDGKFVAELKETADVRDYPKAKRCTEMPQVWAFRSAVTLDALHNKMGMQHDVQERFPVLSNVLQQPTFPVLKALCMLVGLFEWHMLVTTHFSGRITRAQAGELKVINVINSFPPVEREKWERAFDQFRRAWTISWPFVKRHECLEIPENLRGVKVNSDSSMLWCIADSQGNGICPLALTQWLVERHNELVQVVSNARSYPSRKVSSRLLGQHDVITYHEEDLMRFLHTRCVTYGDGGKLNFDLQQLETHLRAELSRPEITIELRAFQWLGESVSAGNELRTVMKQRDLPPDIAERIKADLSSVTVANMCLQKVQMSVSFILKSGGGLSAENAGEMLLSEYMRTVLSESPDSIPSMTARAEVHLWHVDAFAKLLRQAINKDPMDGVDPRYKSDLSPELEDQLNAVKAELPAVLADTMGSFAEGRLVEAYLGVDVRMHDVLPAIWDEEGSELDSEALNSVLRLLPQGLLMKHWAAVYRSLLEQKADSTGPRTGAATAPAQSAASSGDAGQGTEPPGKAPRGGTPSRRTGGGDGGEARGAPGAGAFGSDGADGVSPQRPLRFSHRCCAALGAIVGSSQKS